MCKISLRLDSPIIYQTTISLYKEQLDIDIITEFLGDATLAASEVMAFGFSGEPSLTETPSENL